MRKHRRELMMQTEKERDWEVLDDFTIIPDDPTVEFLFYPASELIDSWEDEYGYKEEYELRAGQWSPDGGVTWYKWGGSFIVLDGVDIIGSDYVVMKGTEIKIWQLGKNCDYGNYFNFKNSKTCYFDIAGSPMSLIYGNNWDENTAVDYRISLVLYNTSKYLRSILNPKTFLPCKNLKAKECYAAMFSNCTSLVNAPELPATTLTNNCYWRMFQSCTSLTRAPELPAITLVSNCYEKMFYGCSKLNYIKAMFTTTPSSSYTEYWVYGVASTGTFVKNKDATWNVTGYNGIPSGWTVITE